MHKACIGCSRGGGRGTFEEVGDAGTYPHPYHHSTITTTTTTTTSRRSTYHVRLLSSSSSSSTTIASHHLPLFPHGSNQLILLIFS